LTNKGKRYIEFKDGTKMMSNFCQELYSNSFMGVIKHESLGELVFNDLTNGFDCTIKFASVKKKYNINNIDLLISLLVKLN